MLYKINQKIFNWQITSVKNIKQNNSVFVELKHLISGAKYIHLANKDLNNVFCVGFKTVPKNSTGVAHILEHTVLTGSKKYPVRDPFFSMIKRSQQTFMNAFTSQDWTAYPFSTQNKKDYYNLMSVYLDAVFNPLLTKLNFKQEGWRLDIEKNKLNYKGVVYNEMKGAMSSTNSIMAETIKQSLFSNSPYKYNSGGEPLEIPNLTHQNLINFHKKYYNPSNAFFYSYGNFNLEKTLIFIERRIQNIKIIKTQNNIKLEKRRKNEKKLTLKYPNENINKSFQINLNWLICPLENSFLVMAFELLEEILIGNPVAPLRKALIESNVGTDLADENGYTTEFRDTIFSIGLKGTKKSDAKKVKKIILDTLNNLIKNKINKKLIDAAIQKQEIEIREITNTPYPYGLKILMDFMGPWIHNGKPIDIIYPDNDIKKIKKQLQNNNFFENLIKKYLINNRHRSLVILEPDNKLINKTESIEQKKLDKIQKNLSKQEIEEIKNNSQKLLKLQEKKEDLSCLPNLSKKDIKINIKKIKPQKKANNLLLYKANTNKLTYFSLLFNINNLEFSDKKLLPFFCYLLNKIGTKQKNYKELSNYINRWTGGINFIPIISKSFGNQKYLSAILCQGKCLKTNSYKMINIINEIISNCDFSNTKIIKNYFLDFLSKIESGIIENGHVYAQLMSVQNFSESLALSEKWNGISQLKYLQNLKKQINRNNFKNLINNLNEIKNQIFNNSKIKIAVIKENKISTTENNAILKINKKNKNMQKKSKKSLINNNINTIKNKYFFQIPTTVSFTALSIKTINIIHNDSAGLYVLAKFLSRGFLHSEIREKGGAYGGFAKYDYIEGVFSFGSYRDPKNSKTFKTYIKAREYILKEKIIKSEIDEAILMAITDINKPNTQVEESQKAFWREQINFSDELRLKFKKNILQITEKKIKQTAKKYLPDSENKAVSALIGLSPNTKLP